MTEDESKDHLAVRVKHRGPCPYEKGHDDGNFGFGMVVGILITVFVFAAVAILTAHK